jgi:hypothetical protein
VAGVARPRADRGDISKLAHVVETIHVHRQPLATFVAHLVVDMELIGRTSKSSCSKSDTELAKSPIAYVFETRSRKEMLPTQKKKRKREIIRLIVQYSSKKTAAANPAGRVAFTGYLVAEKAELRTDSVSHVVFIL